jgi:transglutaminase-like putative cysteine protease
MHTEAQLKRAARNAGCRVLSIREVETPVGRVIVARFEGENNEAAFRLLLEFAADDVGDPVARTIGLELRQRFGPDQVRMAKALQEWVKQHVVYLAEPTETFQAPWYTVRTGVGDCDDHANLVHAIARNAGMKARIVPVRNREGLISHACTQIFVDGVWSWTETTLDADFDEAPRAAASRLRAEGRSDIAGAEGDAMTVVLTGANIPLRQGLRYRARARVDTPKMLTPASRIQAFFEDTGFKDVLVFTTAAALPADWPADQRQEISGGALGGWTVFVEGTWSLADQGLKRPEAILAVWQADEAVAPTSSEPGKVTLPEIVIVGDVPSKGVDWKVGAFLVGTAAAVMLTALLEAERAQHFG